MTTTLFADTNFKGKSAILSNDIGNLRDINVGNNPRSVKMTSDNDAVLLCNTTNWNGEVLYLRGAHQISDLNDPNTGGSKGLGNSISSTRSTPFKVRVNVSIVTGDDGTLPGTWSSRTAANADIATIIEMANDFYNGQNALLNVALGDITFRADEKRFRMDQEEWSSIPASWKVIHQIDVVFPDTIEGAVGLGNFPWHGKFCLVSARRDTVDQMARTFVHELGHYWSLVHQTEPANIMTQSSTGKPLVNSRLTNGQIQDIQQVLARNIARQGDRIE